MRNVSDRCCRENRNANFMFNYFFLPEDRVVCEIMLENYFRTVTDRRWQYGARALHAGCLRLLTFRICNTCCFFTATVVTRTLPTVALFVHCLFCAWFEASAAKIVDHEYGTNMLSRNVRKKLPLHRCVITHSCSVRISLACLECHMSCVF
jgi:hypothetical protein